MPCIAYPYIRCGGNQFFVILYLRKSTHLLKVLTTIAICGILHERRTKAMWQAIVSTLTTKNIISSILLSERNAREARVEAEDNANTPTKDVENQRT